jgi:hypothetical protein
LFHRASKKKSTTLRGGRQGDSRICYDSWCERKLFQWRGHACFGARAELRSALQDASRARLAAACPTGLGVRARQRRFPAHARRFGWEPKRRLPLLPATGHPITRLEIDDALDAD